MATPSAAPSTAAALPLSDRLAARIDGRRDALVTLARDLVRIPTVNPPGDAYEACARFLGERLAARGFHVDYQRATGTPGDSARHPRMNVVARIEAARPGRCVHFNGHIDVVEPGSGWTVDPFQGLVRDGRLYGRGSCDMKGGLAAAIIAAEVLLDERALRRGALEISGTVDEESGGFGGVAWLAERGYFSAPRVDHVIIPEPLNVDRVCLGHRGVWWSEIEMRGRVAHGSMPFLGISAIRGMASFLAAVERELYPKLDARRTRMPVEPPGARASTLNFNSLHGGLAESRDGLPSPLVAESCRLVLDRRFLIEEELDTVKREIVELLERTTAAQPGLSFAMRDIMTFLPTMTEPDAPVVRALDAAIRRVLGRDPAHIASPGTYDQKHIARIGHLHDCVAYGPGILELAHQPDEYVVIDDMVASAKIMAAAMVSLLGLAE
jgi:succinyl-diaminopimelate desuccinylase